MLRAVQFRFCIRRAIYEPLFNLNYTSLQHVKKYSASPPQKPPTFFGKLYENLKEELQRNQKLKESLKDFRKDMEELERSEALQKAREKYRTVEEETAEGTRKAKIQLESLRKKVKETVEEAQKTEIFEKASRVTEEATKTAQRMTETISQKGEKIAKSRAYKNLSDTARVVKEEIDQSAFGKQGRVYRPPDILKRRVERDAQSETKIIEANTVATGLTLHKDSKFSQSWQDFKNNNPYVNRVLEWKTKLDESDNPVIRASILVKDKVTELFGGLFQRTELSEALTEICKMDPSFDKERFLLECEFVIIPNILEAMIRPDLKVRPKIFFYIPEYIDFKERETCRYMTSFQQVLEDWCYERAYQVLATPVKQAQQLGFHFNSQVLDVDNVDLVMGKVMDEGPVLALSFQSQQIMCVKNSQGEIVEGDPTKVMRVQYVWVLCRDQMELNPQAAWRLLDLSAQSTEQFV